MGGFKRGWGGFGRPSNLLINIILYLICIDGFGGLLGKLRVLVCGVGRGGMRFGREVEGFTGLGVWCLSGFRGGGGEGNVIYIG